MTIFRMIYASQPFDFDELSLAAILASARHHNKRNGLTGSLICRKDLFLQLLEGEMPAVEATYARIFRDSRHVDVTRLYSGEAPERLFAQWDMRHDPMRSWMWTPEEVEDGAVGQASAEELIAIFKRVAAERYVADPL